MTDEPTTDDLFQDLLPTPEKEKQRPPAKPAPHYPAYAAVAVNDPVESTYDYGIPQALLDQVVVGVLVEVPFGGRRTRGCVIDLRKKPAAGVAAARIKPIGRIVSPQFQVDASLIELSRWISDYYLSPLGETIGCVSFIGHNDIGARTDVRYRAATSIDTTDLKPTARHRAVMDYLGSVDYAASAFELRDKAGASPAVLKTMLKKGMLEIVLVDNRRLDEYGVPPQRDTALKLNEAQALAFRSIMEAADSRESRTFLIHGITGSGKTEVYLQLISRAVAEGGTAIVLVPEISLTPQAVDRFRARFGDMVGVYHSRMTLGQKFDLWRRVRSGECRIMVGARSALFTPFENLRFIIIDEEHESSYKQDSAPRYHARDTAIVRAQMESAVVVLGSATPSVESYYKAQSGKFTLLNLPGRVENSALPEVQVINMTEIAREEHNPDIFSGPLQAAINGALERQEQALLLLNRRGFFNFMTCLECGKVVRCAHCDVALTHHKGRNALVCHYCEREYVIPRECPDCRGTDVSLIGFGTQRVEEIVQEKFPDARVIRMDLDTTRQRTAFLDAWRRIERGDVDIILGTQMIAKGIHVENVTVVGVPLADVSLFQPDFRCAERAFSLLTQVAGRAGRGSKPGVVYVQSYVPHHYAIVFARMHDYVGFFRKEIRVREVLRFPPFYRLLSLMGSGKDAEETERLFVELSRDIRDMAFRTNNQLSVLGPAPAPIARINDQYRWRLLLRAQDHRVLKNVTLRALEKFNDVPGHSKIQVTIDVDPLDLL